MAKGKKLGIKIPAIIILVILVLWLVLLGVNYCFTLSLRSYIKSFDPVDYGSENRIKPTKAQAEEYAYSYTIGDDEELNIMVLTDLHVGGGCWSHRKDMKTIYEVITMLQKGKPDLVILDGDNIFAVPGPVYNGGGTLNNKMVSKTILELFEHEQVYFTTVFGNHDTEVFDYSSRKALGELYQNSGYEYCIFHQDFTDADAEIPSITNQIIPVQNAKGENIKLLMLIDTNAYVDKSISAVLNWDYDIIHRAQADWARFAVASLSKGSPFANKKGYVGTLAFFHIPFGEYEVAYRDLKANAFNDTQKTKYVSGVWDEQIDEALGGRIWFGGWSRFSENPEKADQFFEILGPSGIGSLEGCFCGHDHVNTAVVEYRGVTLSYGNSLDNLAYTDVDRSGSQRGCTVITVKADGSWEQVHKNVYTDFGASLKQFTDVYVNHPFYDGAEPDK